MISRVRVGSAIGLLATVICVVSLLASDQGASLDARFGFSILLISFGYLLLSRNTTREPEGDPPWWW